MDGSISNHAPDVAQRYGVRYQKALGHDRSSNSEALFEQLLSIPVTPQVLPQGDTETVVEEGEGLPTASATADETDPNKKRVDEQSDDEERDPRDQYSNALEVPFAIQQIQSTEIAPEDATHLQSANQSTDVVQPLTDVTLSAPAEQQVVARPAADVTAEQTTPATEVPLNTASGTVARTSTVSDETQSTVVENESSDAGPTELISELTQSDSTTDAAPIAQVVDINRDHQSDRPEFAATPVSADDQQAAQQESALPVEKKATTDSQDRPIISQNYEEKSPIESSTDESNQREKWYEHKAAASEFDHDKSPNSGSDQRVSLDFSLEPQSSGEYSSTVEQARVDPAAAIVPTDFTVANSVTPTTIAIASTVNSAQLPSPGVVSSVSSDSARPIDARVGSSSINSSVPAGLKVSTDGEVIPEDPAAKPVELTQQERIRLVQRVARSFTRLCADGGQISLRLHPPELGALSVTVRIEGRSMSARMETESSAAREVILENLPQLRQRLSEQGFEVQQIQVELANSQTDASSGGFQHSLGQHASNDQRSSSNAYQIDYRRLAMQANGLAPAVESHRPPTVRAISRTLDLQV